MERDHHEKRQRKETPEEVLSRGDPPKGIANMKKIPKEAIHARMDSPGQFYELLVTPTTGNQRSFIARLDKATLKWKIRYRSSDKWHDAVVV